MESSLQALSVPPRSKLLICKASFGAIRELKLSPSYHQVITPSRSSPATGYCHGGRCRLLNGGGGQEAWARRRRERWQRHRVRGCATARRRPILCQVSRCSAHEAQTELCLAAMPPRKVPLLPVHTYCTCRTSWKKESRCLRLPHESEATLCSGFDAKHARCDGLLADGQPQQMCRLRLCSRSKAACQWPWPSQWWRWEPATPREPHGK